MRTAPILISKCCTALALWLASLAPAPAAPAFPDNPSPIPAPGAHELLILSPTLLELTRVGAKPPEPARVDAWDWIDAGGRFKPPAAGELIVTAAGKPVPVQQVGFKRRTLYAPLKTRDLRYASHLYLQLAQPIPEGATVEVKNPSATLWPAKATFTAKTDPDRFSPVIHVNQVGYLPAQAKQAMVGWYLGSLGELSLAPPLEFTLINTADGKTAFQGQCAPRPDRGFTFQCYQAVLVADFTDFKQPGEYQLKIAGLGTSYPFVINDGVAATLARSYALGLYHQRCGCANEMPFTRYIHGPCHTAPAEVPTLAFAETQRVLAQETENATRNPRHTAPPLKDVSASLYPFVRTGKIDVSGGHHDAGDYSKYTINSAALIHHLVFAADAFPGAGELDNLGLPESGDGKSDLLQEAKWEADFLARMQDEDGGFYFLVYPRHRRYENDVLPDHGDPQVVWPKTTSVTAAAVAALAQTASSPLFKKQFPQAAARYLAKAKLGWQFLERAIARHGKDGAYQKITHYGDEFMHHDELAWAACELYLATGDRAFHERLTGAFNPDDPNTRRWTWWRMYECYGRAIRSYALAVKSGRATAAQLDPNFLARCETEIIKSGEDELRRSNQSAYATSFPEETKRVRSAGWYFSSGQAFDLAAACALDYPERNDPRAKFIAALLGNLNYEAGCNPVNVCYITGLGWHHQREIVHHYAQNDWRVLPPGGIPLGNIQAGFGWMDAYKKELGALSFPPDGEGNNPYPFYDRWGDSFNLQTEFVVTDSARALAVGAFLMAQTPLKNLPWKPAAGRVLVSEETVPGKGKGMTARLESTPDLPLDQARIVWEVQGEEPSFGRTRRFSPATGPRLIEAEAQFPDGRRLTAATNWFHGPSAPASGGTARTGK
jgi:hypothetical protein